MPGLRDLLLIIRAPLAITAVADALAGYLLATLRVARSAAPGDYPAQLYLEQPDPKAIALLALASSCLYWAGMALNDFFDRERDRKLYPFRPIPSGRLRAPFVLALGLALLGLGAAFAFFAGGRFSGLWALVVAACVLSYDGFLKRSRLGGAYGMAVCRTTNVWLGATVAFAHGLGPEDATTLPEVHAIAIGTYVFALTLLSTFEDEDAPPAAVLLGFGGAVAVPIVLLSVFAKMGRFEGAPIFLAHVLLVLVLAHGAIVRGTKATGHTMTRWLIRGLLLLDAGALLSGGFRAWAAFVLALFVPLAVGAKLLFRPPPVKR